MNHIYRTIIALTITMMNSKQQLLTKVFQTSCINATKEKSFSLLLENEITLLCLSINILNIGAEES